MRGALLALLLLGCSAKQDLGECDLSNPKSKLSILTAYCAARVRFECHGIPSDRCPAVAECDKAIDEVCK